MQKKKLTRGEVLSLFDKCQSTYDDWQSKKQLASIARSQEIEAENEYNRAKKAWEDASIRFFKELHG